MLRQLGDELCFSGTSLLGVAVCNGQMRNDGRELTTEWRELRKLSNERLGERHEWRRRFWREIRSGRKPGDSRERELERLRSADDALNALKNRGINAFRRHEREQHGDVRRYAQGGRLVVALPESLNKWLCLGNANYEPGLGHCGCWLTLDMSGGWKRAKHAGRRPLDGRVRRDHRSHRTSAQALSIHDVRAAATPALQRARGPARPWKQGTLASCTRRARLCDRTPGRGRYEP